MSTYPASFFDEIIDRRGTHNIKHEGVEMVFGEPDILPLWVADMDFRVPDEVTEKIIQRAQHHIYGYTFCPPGFFQSSVEWMKRRHNWDIKPEWLSFSPGIVPALNLCVMAYTQPGDQVIIQTPVYPPFFTAVKNHHRELVCNPLAKTGNGYEMDFDHLKKVITKKTKMLVLCHPHNPVGRVWTRQELEQLAEICVSNRIIVICDMIHSDLILDGSPCPSFIDISPEIADLTISCIAPSKTFNTAGLVTSLVMASNPDMKRKFDKILDDVHVGLANIFGLTALEAAYRYGDSWLDSLLKYLNTNFDLLDEWTSGSQYVQYIRSQGTYLAWLDFSPSGLSGSKLYDTIIHQAKVGLNRGLEFGTEGASFMRMNLGCPSSVVKQAIRQIDETMKSLS